MHLTTGKTFSGTSRETRGRQNIPLTNNSLSQQKVGQTRCIATGSHFWSALVVGGSNRQLFVRLELDALGKWAGKYV